MDSFWAILRLAEYNHFHHSANQYSKNLSASSIHYK
jgi:hypothetical protein